MIRGLLVPDLQHGPGRPTRHLTALSKFIAHKQFDVIIQIGDLGDFTSLSSYDKGKGSAEGRRVSQDWGAFRSAVELLSRDWAGKSGYKPRLIYTEGNHEARIKRYAEDNPHVDVLPSPCAWMRDAGWEAYPFLHVAKVAGTHVSHFFPRSLTGAVTSSGMRYGAANARNMVRANMASCIAGHKPGIDWAMVSSGDRTYHGLIAGSYYLHDEDFMGPQQRYWRGVCVLNRMHNGEFDPSPVNIKYLLEKYK